MGEAAREDLDTLLHIHRGRVINCNKARFVGTLPPTQRLGGHATLTDLEGGGGGVG